MLRDFPWAPAVSGNRSEILLLSPFGPGRFLAADAAGGFVVRSEGGTDAPRLVFSGPAAPEAVAASPDHSLLAYAAGGTVVVADLADGRRTYRLAGLKGKVLAAEFSPDGNALLLAGVEGRVYRWSFRRQPRGTRSVSGDRSLERYIGHSAVVGSLRYHPFGRVFFSADWSGVVSGWLAYDRDEYGGRFDRNLFTGKTFTDQATRRIGTTATGAIERLAVSTDGEWLASATTDGSLQLWKVRGLVIESTVKAHDGVPYDVTFHRDSERVVSVGRDGSVKEWRLAPVTKPGGRIVREFGETRAGRAPGVRRLLFSDDGTVVGGAVTGSVGPVSWAPGGAPA